MKAEQRNADRNFSKRVFTDFTQALLGLLQEKSLESISATELCKRSRYPRSTFYNYFEDIYALMDDCWKSIASKMEVDRFQEIPHEERTATLFTMFYSYMKQHEELLAALLKHNPPNGAMCRSLNAYMCRSIERMVTECPCADDYPIPLSIVAEHYSNTVWMLLEHCFLSRHPIDRESALQSLNYLLGTLEKENRK